MVEILKLEGSRERSEVCERVLRKLPEWFGIEQAVVDYINDVKSMETWVAKANDETIGFVSLKAHGETSAEIYVMGVLKEHHRSGVGRALVEKAEDSLARQGFRFLQVKTLSPARPCREYDQTRNFYLKMGFVVVY